MSAALNTLVLISILYLTAEAMAASEQPQQPLRPYLTSMMESAILNTLVSMCILPVAFYGLGGWSGLQIWAQNGLRGHSYNQLGMSYS